MELKDKKIMVLIQFFLYPYQMNIKKILEDEYDFFFIDRFGVHDKNYNRFLNRDKSKINEKLIYILKFPLSIIWFIKNRKKIDVVLGITELNWFVFPFFILSGKKIQKIMFPYEITYFRKSVLEKYSKIELLFEKINFKIANKIIHKGLTNELSQLPYYEKIKDKPSKVFREHLDKSLVQEYNPKDKISTEEEEIHIVFIGGLYMKNMTYADSIWEMYPKITSQKIHLYIYSKVDKKTEEIFKQIERKDKYFHYCGTLNHEVIIKEITKYDYGYYLHTWNRAKLKNNHYVKNTIGNKVFDYISAKLPVLCINDNEAISELIENYGVGIHIDYEDLSNLKSILKEHKKDYKKHVEEIEKATKRLSNHKSFIKFIGAPYS